MSDVEMNRASQISISYGVEYYDKTDKKWTPLAMHGTELSEADETFEMMQRQGYEVRLMQYQMEVIRTGRMMRSTNTTDEKLMSTDKLT
ncbi:hypothetical protein PP304_gp056 [Gordonia phage Phendrix]|uniref:Uncharacterized protein n=2 Tax=Godonkavirus TaxID=2733178 RepID=A0A4D6E234_9CAUD|nr:hypothetical protein HOV33_gp057 [Gordonia phage GodonK]YP_010649100.1 hypothetical protein PP304_gp056 [Gordonia phage Phendrix]QBZ72676.1 hypothetical protein SEA_GODONK_57 [Gordonia phage GodonK]QDK02604.1 hypothetical protein SEA_PHENDRIX_56 [Gordonia phage Phendrix]